MHRKASSHKTNNHDDIEEHREGRGGDENLDDNDAKEGEEEGSNETIMVMTLTPRRWVYEAAGPFATSRCCWGAYRCNAPEEYN